jgi:Ca2+-binding EF-hand superfamily protein
MSSSNLFDVNNDGVLDESETNLQVTIEEAWKKFDENGDGTINSTELQALIESIDENFLNDDEHHIDDIMADLDSSGDGVLSKREFIAWWTEKTGSNDLRKLAEQAVKKSKTDIFKACWEDQKEIVKHFLDLSQKRGLNLANQRDPTPFGDKYTPLHYAAYQGHIKICELLEKAGANLNAVNGAGCTPLFLACQQGHPGVVKFLLKNGALVSPCDLEYSLSAFDVAANDKIRSLFKEVNKLQPPTKLPAPSIKRVESANSTGAAVVVKFSKYEPEETDLPVNGYIIELKESEAETWDDAFETFMVAETATDKTYKGIDEDGDGGISRNELKGAILHMDPGFFSNFDDDDEIDEEVKRLFEELDADDSGSVSKREFIDFLRKSPECQINSSKKLREKMLALEETLTPLFQSRIDGLFDDVEYVARVAVVNGMGRGANSSESVPVRMWKRPKVIKSIRAVKIEATKVTLEWKQLLKSKSRRIDVDEIIVIGGPRQRRGKQSWKALGRISKPYAGNTYTVKKLSESTDYVLKLLARNKSGKGKCDKTDFLEVRTIKVGESPIVIDSENNRTFGQQHEHDVALDIKGGLRNMNQ